MGIHSKMTAIADKIRTLLGITGTMGLDAMSENLDAAVNQNNSQAELIYLIKAALVGKGAGDGVSDITLDSITLTPQKTLQEVTSEPGSAFYKVTVNPIPDQYHELPLLDPVGTAEDLASGKQLIGANGELIEGTVATYDSIAGWKNRTPTVDGENVSLSINTNIPYLFRNGVFMSTPLSNFGTASPEHVLKDVTFTSGSGLAIPGNLEFPGEVAQATPSISVGANGLITAIVTQEAGLVAAGTKVAELQLSALIDSNLKSENIVKGASIFGVEGSHECEEKLELPSIAEDVLGTANDLVAGKQLIGPDGEIVTGAIREATPSFWVDDEYGVTGQVGGNYVKAMWNITDDTIFRKGNSIELWFPVQSIGAVFPSGTRNIGDNGTYDVTQYASVNVNVPTSSGGGYQSGDIVKAHTTSATLASGYNVSSVSASDSVTKDANGVVSLSGVTSTVAISSIDLVKGRYVKASSGSIYYVPADATITQSGSTYSKTYTVDKANLMFVLA